MGSEDKLSIKETPLVVNVDLLFEIKSSKSETSSLSSVRLSKRTNPLFVFKTNLPLEFSPATKLASKINFSSSLFFIVMLSLVTCANALG